MSLLTLLALSGTLLGSAPPDPFVGGDRIAQFEETLGIGIDTVEFDLLGGQTLAHQYAGSARCVGGSDLEPLDLLEPPSGIGIDRALGPHLFRQHPARPAAIPGDVLHRDIVAAAGQGDRAGAARRECCGCRRLPAR